MSSTMCLEYCGFGKPASRSPLVASAGNQQLFFLTDRISGQRFLVDTGAEISVFPSSIKDRRSERSGPPLAAANGSAISTYGTRNISLEFHSRTFNWSFTIADVVQPLLGADFLRAFSLLVDLKSKRLIDVNDLTSLAVKTTNAVALHLNSVSLANDPYGKILKEFPIITVPSFTQTPNKSCVEHFVTTNGPPLSSRTRRLAPDKLLLAKQEFRTMEEMGIIRRSSSAWASPLHMVPKNGGGWRSR